MHDRHRLPSPPLILASTSPRRSYLLRQIGFEFEVRPSHIDENLPDTMSPEEHVSILSARKAEEVASHVAQGIILGADTIVVLDDAILNKPNSPDDAVRMLSLLSGRKHEVFTGITLIDVPSHVREQAVEKTEVWFRSLDPEEIRMYVQTGSPMDKAGAYGIQDDYGAVFVEKIHGCFYNVVGLPLSRFHLLYHKLTQETRSHG